MNKVRIEQGESPRHSSQSTRSPSQPPSTRTNLFSSPIRRTIFPVPPSRPPPSLLRHTDQR